MRKIFVFAVLFLILAGLIYIYTTPRVATKAEIKTNLLGTIVEIKAYGRGAQLTADEAINSIKKTQKLLNKHEQRSEIALINNMAGVAAVAVSPTTFAIIKQSIELSKETKGFFDITVGPLADLWKEVIKNKTLPSQTEVKTKVRLTDFRLIDLDYRLETIKLPTSGMNLDLGAIGKGYAFDLAKGIFKNKEIESALLSSGSTVVAVGEKPDGNPWKIMLRNPRPTAESEYLGYIELADQALSVSGDWEQFVEIDGTRYSHVLDPMSGYPAKGVQMVAVIAENGTLADAYSTAVFVMGVREGLYFLNVRKNVEGLIVDSKGNVHTTRNFDLKTEEEVSK